MESDLRKGRCRPCEGGGLCNSILQGPHLPCWGLTWLAIMPPKWLRLPGVTGWTTHYC